MINEQEIALGSLLAASHACFLAYKRLEQDSGYAPHGSRLATFAGASSREIKEAYELTEKASRLIEKAVCRMRRYEEEQS